MNEQGDLFGWHDPKKKRRHPKRKKKPVKRNDQYDLELGREERDRGIKKVVGNNSDWFHEAILVLHRSLPIGWTGIPEDWRPIVESFLGAPTHRNTWGGLTLSLIRRGFIRKTGERRQMQRVKSHARKTDVYERI